jgi:D-glycero-alpha-D-manno-heptose-7-phosphate kinase
MIITRTPFRVSFAGGGTDLPSFYRAEGYGAVVSATIKRFMYIAIHPYFQRKLRIKYSQTEDVSSIDEIRHPIVRECLKKLDVGKGVEIASFSDVPAGTGLGSSSAFTVGLLHALYSYKDIPVSKERLAREACEVEIELLGEPIGKQDQYAAAYGGLNHFKFNDDESVEVQPISISASQLEFLEATLSLNYVGGDRPAGEILGRISAGLKSLSHKQSLLAIREQVGEVCEVFRYSDRPNLGPILSKGWEAKKKLDNGVSSRQIEEAFALAQGSHLMGGKLLGAGGAGFLLLQHYRADDLARIFCPDHIPFEFDNTGTTVLFRE